MAKVALGVACAFIILKFVFGVTQISDEGMYPKLMAGDLAVYSRIGNTYRLQDVVHVTVGGQGYVLRVAAQGGDIVDFSDDGFFILNGQVQYEEVVDETLLPQDSPLAYPYTVPYGSFFLLGDARSVCTDSRTFGAVQEDMIDGKLMCFFRHRKF